MKNLLFLGLIVSVLFFATSVMGQERDVFSDTWVATDDLGRSLPLSDETGPPRDEKFIGIFYFLWNGRHGEEGPYDVTKILAQDPDAMQKPDSPLWGKMYVPHHWGESIFNYYVGEDEGVLRKHAQMLGDAGVDVVIFDVTNQLTYPESYRALCKVFHEVRAAGNHAPQIAFLTPFWSPSKVVHELWNDFYSKGDYEDLWFRWKGKPLILADPALIHQGIADVDGQNEKISEFFTFRKPQPDYFVGPTGPDQWGWLEVSPQHSFFTLDENGKHVVEQMAVGVAQNAVDGKLSVLSNPRSHGRSFHNGKEPAPKECDFTGQNFQEQWNNAFQVDPDFVFITGWNEWIMGRFDEKAPFHAVDLVTFVDQFNQEFSRDIEPILGGHADLYYYQMIANIRKFKGTRPIPMIAPQPISIDGMFDDWKKVAPEFRDTVGDPVQRDERGWGTEARYINNTGRNDLNTSKVSCDSENVYFYVKTTEPVIGTGTSNSMMLFVDSDCDPKTGWLGYDFIINRLPVATTDLESVSTLSLEKNSKNEYQWEMPVEISGKAKENEFELAIPISVLGGTLPKQLDFKWADNIQQTGDCSDFTLNGDVAPNDRYNYRAIFHHH